jgi:hypothetical protein
VIWRTLASVLMQENNLSSEFAAVVSSILMYKMICVYDCSPDWLLESVPKLLFMHCLSVCRLAYILLKDYKIKYCHIQVAVMLFYVDSSH